MDQVIHTFLKGVHAVLWVLVFFVAGFLMDSNPHSLGYKVKEILIGLFVIIAVIWIVLHQ